MFKTTNRITKSITKMNARYFLVIIPQATVAYRQFLGQGRIMLTPGLRLNLPIFHDTQIVDLRERSKTIEDMHCFTKDNVPVLSSGTLFYKVVDAEKACFSVNDYEDSIFAIGNSSVRALIGRFDYDEIIKEREKINLELRKIIGKSTEEWGIDCTRFEMNVFEPQNSNVQKQMEKQMEAERLRRENELHTLASIRTAEGKKLADIEQADATFYTTQKCADAETYSINKLTESLVNKITEIKRALPNLTDEQIMTILLEEKRLNHLQQIASGPNNSTYFVDPTSSFPSFKALISK